jgi:glycine oxidase
MKNNRVFIIGGGIIGLSVGWQLLRQGADTEIFERGEAGKGAGWVAAGMLAPEAELGFEEMRLFKLCKESLSLYPRFVEELSHDSGMEVKLDRCGSLLVGFDRDDNERLRRLYMFRESVGLPVEWKSGSEARELEPLLSPKCTGAIWISDDAQTDSRNLLTALKTAFVKLGGVLYENTKVDSLVIENGIVTGLITGEDRLECSKVVIAAGAWSKQIGGIPENLLPPVRPVKGQIISLKMNDEFKLTHAVRAPDVYFAPKSDGRLILGASVEEMGFDTNPTAGEIYRLLERGWETIPSIYDLPIESIDVGLRPGSRDHEPIIGASGIEGLYFATGHYRNGILLTPVTAYELSGWIAENRPSEILKDFQLSRFYKEIMQ